MSHITTFTGIQMDPSHPKSDEICIEDIAHALSLMTRANGHFKTFYSVAQHCIGCANEAKARGYSEKVQLACLLHDASEAYISDITRPVKAFLPEYKKIENTLQNLIWNKWLPEPLSEEEYKAVFAIDDAMLYHEFLYFMGEELFTPRPVLMLEHSYDFEDFTTVENTFLLLFKDLI